METKTRTITTHTHPQYHDAAAKLKEPMWLDTNEPTMTEKRRNILLK